MDDASEDVDWLEKLTVDAFPLIGDLNFASSISQQSVHLDRSKFEREFASCLNTLRSTRPKSLPPETIDELYKLAIYDLRLRDAVRAALDALNGDSFRATYDFIRQEQHRLAQISRVLETPRPITVPKMTLRWEAVWIASLRDLAKRISGQLRNAAEYMREMQRLEARSDQIQTESYILSLSHVSIKRLLKNQKLGVGAMTVLVAYAHAAGLVYCRDGDSLRNMKERIANQNIPIRRLKPSQKQRRAEVLGLLFAQLCNKRYEGSKL